jgi:hypothetical protein
MTDNAQPAPAKTYSLLPTTNDQRMAFFFGLKDGMKFWQIQMIPYSKIDDLDTSPDIKAALKNEYWYYTLGADVLQYVVAMGAILYMGVTNAPALMTIVTKAAGIG